GAPSRSREVPAPLGGADRAVPRTHGAVARGEALARGGARRAVDAPARRVPRRPRGRATGPPAGAQGGGHVTETQPEGPVGPATTGAPNGRDVRPEPGDRRARTSRG